MTEENNKTLFIKHSKIIRKNKNEPSRSRHKNYTKDGDTKGGEFSYSRPDKISLSPREAEVLALLARGLRTSQIAHALGISNVTVDMHIRNGRTKLGAATREHAVTLALYHQLIMPFDE